MYRFNSIAVWVMNLAKSLLVGLVWFYKLFLSPFLGGRCRFEPSCSSYALEALRTHGAWAGSWLAFRRVCRCRPGGGLGYDPVPKTLVCPEPIETPSEPDLEDER